MHVDDPGYIGRTAVAINHPLSPTDQVLLDRRAVRRGAAVVDQQIVDAYRYDALSLGIIWSVAGYDACLLDDDTELASVERAPVDAIEAAHATWSNLVLSAAGQMLTGSRLCAHFIGDNLADVRGTPVFWTREQRGEEAATWLLFAHKYAYLCDTAPKDPRSETTGRAFCVPRQAVDESPLHERVLMLLAIALMESFGIRTWICPDPDFAVVDGFALLPDERVVVASWVGALEAPRLATSHSPGSLRTYGDTLGEAKHLSVTAADRSTQRLAASADYLGIDRGWFRRRCAELSAVGVAGLATPRSRYLSLDGLEAALLYAALHVDASR